LAFHRAERRAPSAESCLHCDYPEPWLNLRGLLAGMAWMAPR
jgi:hypothetical protein